MVEFRERIKKLGMPGREVNRMLEAIMVTDESGTVDLRVLQSKFDRLESDNS